MAIPPLQHSKGSASESDKRADVETPAYAVEREKEREGGAAADVFNSLMVM